MLCEGRFALYLAGEPYKSGLKAQGCGKLKKAVFSIELDEDRRSRVISKKQSSTQRRLCGAFCYGILWTERNNHKESFMDSYVTGTAIRQLREAKHMTQAELAEKLAVSAKAISKWETARGLPDISLLEPLAAALAIGVLG